MAIEYTNRVGDTYRLLETTTKQGKSHYFFSRNPKSKGTPVEKIPESFEIYEHPRNAQVFLRKQRPQLITELERHFVEKHLDKLNRDHLYRLDVKDRDITIYESNQNITRTTAILQEGPGIFAGRDLMRWVMKQVERDYTEIMRFRLVDDKQRLFEAERWCFRGSVDDWIYIGGPASLQTLVEKYIPTLGTDAFFELY